MSSRAVILVVVLGLGLALAAVALFVTGERGGQPSAPAGVEPGGRGPLGPPEPVPDGADGADGAGAGRAPAGAARDTAAALEPASDAVLGAQEAELTVLVLGRETGHPLSGVGLFLMPDDEPGFSAPRAFRSSGRLGEALRTDERGEACYVIPAGRALVLHSGERRGVCGPAQTRISALRPLERSRIVIKPPTAADRSFFGRVRDGTSGAPVAGARIVVHETTRRRAFGHFEPEVETFADVTSGADGLFEVRLPSWASLNARVEAAGYAPAVVPVTDAAATREEAVLVELLRAAQLAVLVVDDQAAGVAGIDVQLETQTRNVVQDPGALPRVAAPEAVWSAATDADGLCTFSDLPPGAELWLELRDGEDLLVREAEPIVLAAGESRTREIVVHPGLRVQGVLTDRRGLPVEMAELWMVRTSSEHESVCFRAHDAPAFKTLTGSDGRFVFRDVAAGLWAIGPSPNFPPNLRESERLAPVGQPLRVTAEERSQEIAIEADRGRYITGRVADPEGHPLSGVAVDCAWTGSACSLTQRSDEEGRFSFGPLARGEYRLVASPQRGDDFQVSARVVAHEGDEVALTVGRGGSVAGKVVDAAGKPCAAEVLIGGTDDPDDPRWSRATSADGSFRFDGNAPGAYALVARTTDGRVGVLRGVKVEEGKTAGDLRLAVGRGATLVVRWEGELVPWMCSAELDGILVAFDSRSSEREAELVVPPGALKVGFAAEALNLWKEQLVEVAEGDAKEVVFP